MSDKLKDIKATIELCKADGDHAWFDTEQMDLMLAAIDENRQLRLHIERLKLAQPAPGVRMFPMLHDEPKIPWTLAEYIYEMYSTLHGKQQTLERIAERGGFGWAEIPFMIKDFKRRSYTGYSGWVARGVARGIMIPPPY